MFRVLCFRRTQLNNTLLRHVEYTSAAMFSNKHEVFTLETLVTFQDDNIGL